MNDHQLQRLAERTLYAKVLVEIGELHAAERELVQSPGQPPEDLTSLNLYAKIKHMRGEISAALHCWGQLHARSPHNEIALTHLSAFLHLAQDPAHVADEFAAMGHFQLVRKPVKHQELERAFQLYLSRKPEEAQALCERLSHKYATEDRQMYKFAVLARSWIAELSGDLVKAGEILEELGHERGFETDTDRVLALARIYERIGTPDKLEAALHICRFLQQNFEKISLTSRLASIHRRLGQAELAAEYERRYLMAFRHRSHRPSFREVTRVAARRYVPLSRLRAIRFQDLDLDESLGRKERGVALALRGDLDGAWAVLKDLPPGPAAELDLVQLYLGDLSVLCGRAAEATAYYLRGLAQPIAEGKPECLPVLGWVLEHGGEAAREFFRLPEVADRALRLVTEALHGEPQRVGYWLLLSALHGKVLGHADEAARCAARAAVLERAAAQQAQPVGRVLAAAVYHFAGKAKGLIHEVWAERRPVAPGRGGFLHDGDLLGNLQHDMKVAVRNTFLSVREYARAKLPHRCEDILDYDYLYKVTKDDEPSGGLSAGLPTAIVFLSVFLQQPVPQDRAFSGMVSADAHDVLVVRYVGETEYKARAAYNRNLRLLVLPQENRQHLLDNREVPREICEELVRYVSTVDEAVTMTFGESIWL